MTTPTPRTDALQDRVCDEADRLIAEGRDAETRERMNDLLQESYDHARRLERELAAAREALRFVERWANHHGQKACVKPEHALSTIQHYPPIVAITKSYADGKVPETRNPWAELDAAKAELAKFKAENETLRGHADGAIAEISHHLGDGHPRVVAYRATQEKS